MNGADLADLGHVHIVGIGGAGMSGIARVLAARGVHVTGSDALKEKVKHEKLNDKNCLRQVTSDKCNTDPVRA